MVQLMTITTLQRLSTPCCSHGLMNTSMNASVLTTLSPSLAFLTFLDPRTSLLDPVPSTNLPSTLPTNASITSFKRSSSRAMSSSTTAKASPILCHRSPTLIIWNACGFYRISLAGLSTLWMIKHDTHWRRWITQWSKCLQAFQHLLSTTSTDQLLIRLRASLTKTLTHLTLTLSPYFEATASGEGNEGSGSINLLVIPLRILVSKMRSSTSLCTNSASKMNKLRVIRMDSQYTCSDNSKSHHLIIASVLLYDTAC